MKLKIKSKQFFEENISDEVEEEYNCEINFLNNGFEIGYDKCNIVLKDYILYINKPELNLTIIKEDETYSSMSTPYGDIKIIIKGIDIEWLKDPFTLKVKYDTIN